MIGEANEREATVTGSATTGSGIVIGATGANATELSDTIAIENVATMTGSRRDVSEINADA